jgi:UDP-hydrolysing UDP-N-acetyl-D-glucosamine 2-epimerase
MKKICVVSGTRADYGLLYWIMKTIQNDTDLELQTIATCMHLSAKFGNTWKNFEDDGFRIDKKIPLGELNDSGSSIVEQVSTGVKEFYQAFKQLAPDLVLILGDRYEMLAASQASVFAGIPIGHIHGGEVTEGAFDDFIRNAITKLSSYHFTSTNDYKRRVIQMGEFPERVINVGAVGLENIIRLKLLSKDELSKSINFNLAEKIFLVTYHPVTASSEDATEQLLSVLQKYNDTSIIITLPNSDPGHDKIIQALTKFAKDNKNVYLTASLGSLRYLSIMKLSNVVIGNSSSGIVEAPFLGVPTLNIGVRQKGRIHDVSVINSDVDEIENKLKVILENSYEISSLYGDGHSSEKIVEYIKTNELTVKAGFYDL